MSPELAPKLWRVACDGSGDFTSLTEAFLKCSDGDTVSLGEGVYSPSTTQEVFPLYVPTGVVLRGQGGASVVDGEGWGRLSNRPLNTYECLLLMGDRSSLQNLTVRNSGGNAVSHVQGARIQVSHCSIHDNGQHGVLLYGPDKAVITNNQFKNNGVKHYEPPTTPIPAPARQGHHVYLEGMATTCNRVTLANNTMVKCFADGFALAPVFDDPKGVEIEVEISGNTIDGCGRNGLTLSASYGTSNAIARVKVLNNTIRNCGSSLISATSIFPLVPRKLSHVELDMVISHNVMEKAEFGVNAVGAFSPGANSEFNLVMNNNQISHCSGNGVFLATAIGAYQLPVANSRLTARIFDNTVENCKDIEMVFYAFQRTQCEQVSEMEMVLSLNGNSSPPDQIVVHEDATGQGQISVQEGSQGYSSLPLA